MYTRDYYQELWWPWLICIFNLKTNGVKKKKIREEKKA